jgi:peptide deformylase
MIRKVLQYGHPMLRQKGARIESIAPAINRLIQDLLDTMYAEKGIGLAAQQIGESLQVTVIDIRGVKDRPSSLELNGAPADANDLMPLVLINPEVKPVGELAAGHEGCLSFLEISAEITRPATVHVVALNGSGQKVEFSCGGLLARAIQHEVDHLNGILFIDRMDARTKAELRPELNEIHTRTKEALQQRGAVYAS